MPLHLPAFLLLTTAISFMPGPAVLFVMSQSGWRGPKAGLAAAAGIQTANTLYFALSGLGLASVIAASGLAFTLLKFAGATYLAWLGVSAMLASFRPHDAPVSAATRRSANGYRDGAMVALGNPKSMLYFLALLPQFIDTSRPLASQIAVLGAFGIGIDFAVDMLYVHVGMKLAQALEQPALRRWYERGVGSVFLGLSAVTALARRAL